MKVFTKVELEQLEKIYRINLINSITGIKPANLIGTKNKDGLSNLAIFSSVVHLGSNPAIIGFFVRPTGEVERHTFSNIIETGYYTINQVRKDKIENAHFTSAKFDRDQSEYEYCNFEEEYEPGFSAPFVKESALKIGLNFLESNLISANQTHLVIGQVELIKIKEDALKADGQISLEKTESVGIGGVDNYYDLSHIKKLAFARKKDLPKW